MTMLDAMMADAKICNVRMKRHSNVGSQPSLFYARHPIGYLRAYMLSELSTGPKTISEIAKSSQSNADSVSWNARKMEADGLIDRIKSGREIILQMRAP